MNRRSRFSATASAMESFPPLTPMATRSPSWIISYSVMALRASPMMRCIGCVPPLFHKKLPPRTGTPPPSGENFCYCITSPGGKATAPL